MVLNFGCRTLAIFARVRFLRLTFTSLKCKRSFPQRDKDPTLSQPRERMGHLPPEDSHKIGWQLSSTCVMSSMIGFLRSLDIVTSVLHSTSNISFPL